MKRMKFALVITSLGNQTSHDLQHFDQRLSDTTLLMIFEARAVEDMRTSANFARYSRFSCTRVQPIFPRTIWICHWNPSTNPRSCSGKPLFLQYLLYWFDCHFKMLSSILQPAKLIRYAALIISAYALNMCSGAECSHRICLRIMYRD